jgi:hypothetical protein
VRQDVVRLLRPERDVFGCHPPKKTPSAVAPEAMGLEPACDQASRLRVAWRKPMPDDYG